MIHHLANQCPPFFASSSALPCPRNRGCAVALAECENGDELFRSPVFLDHGNEIVESNSRGYRNPMGLLEFLRHRQFTAVPSLLPIESDNTASDRCVLGTHNPIWFLETIRLARY